MVNKVRISLCSLASPCHPVLVYPLAVTTLSGYLRKVLGETVEIHIHNSQFENIPQMVASLEKERPDIIGLSLQIGSQGPLVEFMAGIRIKLAPWTNPPLFVFGNVLSTFSAKLLLDEYPNALMVIGEGEEALEAIIKKVSQKREDFEEVPNLTFLKNGRLVETRRKVFDLNKGVIPSFEYLPEVNKKEGHIWIEASRGCNSHCTFCSRYPVRMSEWTPISAAKIIQTIDIFHSRFGITHFRFSDDDFMGTGSLLSSLHAREIAEGIMEKDSNITFDISSRVESIYSSKCSNEENYQKEKILKVLRKAGMTQVFLGVESGSCGQLKRFGKMASVKDNLMAVNKLNSLGIQAVLGFITIDFLMDFPELEENISFLKQAGVFSPGKNIFVSDALVVLRAQEGSSYIKMLAHEGLLLAKDRKSYLTYNALYKDSRVARVAEAIEHWRSRDFSLIYALKNRVSKLSLERASNQERKILEQFLIRFKTLDYKYLIVVSKNVQDEGSLQRNHKIFCLKRIALVKKLSEKFNSKIKGDNSFLRKEIALFIKNEAELIENNEKILA